MPRSAPGPRSRLAVEQHPPVVGWSSPATMRSSVDLPQPEGPRMAMKSLSRDPERRGSSARVGGPPRTPGKVRLTSSIARWARGPQARLQGNSRRLTP